MSFLVVSANRASYRIEALIFEIALAHLKSGEYIVDLDYCEQWPASYIDYHWKAITGLEREGVDCTKFKLDFCKRFGIKYA